MNKSVAILLISLLSLGHAIAVADNQADKAKPSATQLEAGPTPYPADAKVWPGQGAIRVFGWMTDNRKSFWAERVRKQGSVVFAGDSLIGGWGALAKDLPQFPVANRGIGGDTTRGLLFRFNEDVLDLHPKAIVILAGSNDLSAQQDIKQSLANLAEMIAIAGKVAPDVPLVVCTVPPRNHPQAPVDPRQVVELNKLIKSLARATPRVVVFDLYALLVNQDGSQAVAYFAPDRLHLSAAGYERFREGLVPVLKQMNIG